MSGRDRVASHVPRGTLELLDRYVALLETECSLQNLVSQATLVDVWNRHILDSLQLLETAPQGLWADIGSGAGLPGLVIAIASEQEVTLIEPRRKRADFLDRTIETLGLSPRVCVLAQRSENVRLKEPAVISARAVAPLEHLFDMAPFFSSPATTWILPKGRSAAEEVAIAQRTWQGDFRLVPSLTEPGSSIVVAQDIRRRGQT